MRYSSCDSYWCFSDFQDIFLPLEVQAGSPTRRPLFSTIIWTTFFRSGIVRVLRIGRATRDASRCSWKAGLSLPVHAPPSSPTSSNHFKHQKYRVFHHSTLDNQPNPFHAEVSVQRPEICRLQPDVWPYPSANKRHSRLCSSEIKRQCVG